MKKTYRAIWMVGGVIAAAGLATTGVTAQTPTKAVTPPASAPGADPAPAPDASQISYEFGLTYGTQMHAMGIATEVDVDAMTRGLRDGLQGKRTTAATQLQLQTFVRSVQDKIVAKNLAAAADFLAGNSKAPGVVTTASGLEYKVLSPGEKRAAPITAADTVTVQYHGKLLDGSEFDSSYSRNTPTTFPVNGVIKGWQEALVLMKPGAKWLIWVPPALGYGMNWQPKMPGGSLLVFDVDLLSVAPVVDAPPGTPTH